jgi:hypothetical protein
LFVKLPKHPGLQLSKRSVQIVIDLFCADVDYSAKVLAGETELAQ